MYHLTAHRSDASRLAVSMQSETHVPVVRRVRPPAHRCPVTRQERRRLSSHRRPTRSHWHVVHPRTRRGPPERLPAAPHSSGLPFSRHASRPLCRVHRHVAKTQGRSQRVSRALHHRTPSTRTRQTMERTRKHCPPTCQHPQKPWSTCSG